APAGPWLVVAPPGDALGSEVVRALASRGVDVALATTVDEASLTGRRSVVLLGTSASFDGAAERWMTEASMVARTLGAIDAPTLLAAVTRGATDAEGPAFAPL